MGRKYGNNPKFIDDGPDRDPYTGEYTPEGWARIQQGYRRHMQTRQDQEDMRAREIRAIANCRDTCRR